MLSQTQNRVQAIKSKFENLNNDSSFRSAQLTKQLTHNDNNSCSNDKENSFNDELKYNKEKDTDSDSNDEWSLEPNMSYLYSKNEVKRSVSDPKKSLTRQTSDPGKKLHRSHAFRCDRSKIVSPKRHGSCNGRSETSDFLLKGEIKLSKDRLKRLGNLLEDQMRKENFVVPKSNEVIVGHVLEIDNEMAPPLCSIPDSEVPQHILDQYAKVVKPKKNDNDKQDGMTDSGVSSETENLEDEKSGRIKKLLCQFEKSESPEEKGNLDTMNDLCASSETMKLERKNPHLILTDTLKKALKQPLPPGPPPKKPPRVFASSPIPESPERQKKDAKKMLEKLEQVLQKREAQNNTLKPENNYDVAEANLSLKKPKEIHYLCTEILDITHKTLLPNSTNNCFKSLNCAITNNSTLSLPYTRLSAGSNRESIKCCTCSNDSLDRDKHLTTFLTQKCAKCQMNEQKHDQFKCHLNCKCREEMSQFFVDNEHIYDEPFNDDGHITIGRHSQRRSNKYGTLNHSKSLEDLRSAKIQEDQKIYDIPCDISRPATPEAMETRASSKTPDPEPNPRPKSEVIPPKSDFERLRQNFEKGFQTTGNKNQRNSLKNDKILCANDRNSVTNDKVLGTNEKIFGTNARNSVTNDKITGTNENIYGTIERIKTDLTSSIKNVGHDDVKRPSLEKPPMRPKPIFVKNKTSKSSESLLEDAIVEGKVTDNKYSTEGKKYKREREVNGRYSLPKKDSSQLDVDRENLTRLMNEIYETVTACNMADNKPGSFPTDSVSDTISDDSVKLTRSLTEKRKNYVRRVSSRVAYLDTKNIKNTRYRHQTSVCSYKSEIVDNPYSTFRSWKSFRTSQNNLKMERDASDSKFNLTDDSGNVLSMKSDFDSSETIDNESIDEKTGCVDIALPFEPREKGLFNVCLLVGMNYMTGQAYVKSVFPKQVQVPPHIENLIFPETLSSTSQVNGGRAQMHSLVLTNERGDRSYGYCRRVMPEGATICLPLCYCIIGKYRAPGFYYKVLQEIESHHGSSEVEIHSILQQLFESDFPNPGEDITISYTKDYNKHQPAILNDVSKCKTMPDMRRSGGKSDSEQNSDTSVCDFSDREKSVNDSADKVPDFYDLENNNSSKKVFLCLDAPRTKVIKRPIEPRVDEDNLSVLLDCLGAGLTIKVFGSLLLERKLLVMGDDLHLVSSCLEGLQSALYPLVWQQPLISSIPAEIQREVLEAPLPLLAGMLTTDTSQASNHHTEEGMLIDLTHPSKVLFYQGDESTILPTPSYKTLKTSLQMETKKDRSEDQKTRNVMISEAFLRFFVDILGDFWKYFSVGEVKEGDLGKGDVVFDKESYIRSAPAKQTQYFLEWFTETAMFNHFIQNMAIIHEPTLQRQTSNTSFTSNSTSTSQTSLRQMTLVDTPLPNFYELFNERVRCRRKNDSQKFDKSNYKNAMNKRMKLLKTKLRELVT